MAQKHLSELLSEDQEPFLLETYIADRKSQLSRLPKARELTRWSSSNFGGSFCKSACLFSALPDSPDLRKSPLFDFSAASPHKSPKRIFFQVPAKTAALLLEAAIRIQQKGAKPIKQKPAKKGLFGSILKRLKRAAPTREIESHRRRSFGSCRGGAPVSELKSAGGTGTSPRGCRAHSRRSSGLWSESNGERSLDLETSTSGSDCVELAAEEEEVYASFDESLCGSPFRFVLRRSSSSSGDMTPEFASPAASPALHGKEDINHCDAGSSKKLNLEEEEDQCSPISVLDSPFENGQDQEEEDDGFDYECSFANVQRAKQQLLEKLHRFEKLAELDPDELEKRMLELDGDGGEDDGHMSRESSDDDDDDEEPEPSDEEYSDDRFITEVLKSKFDRAKIIPNDMKRLVSDLIVEEQGRQNELGVTLTGRVCERFESWKRVNLNTTGKAVEDLRGELVGWKWKQNQDQVDEVAVRIEFAIFGILVQELLEDLTGKCWSG